MTCIAFTPRLPGSGSVRVFSKKKKKEKPGEQEEGKRDREVRCTRDTYLSVLFVWCISRSLGIGLRLDSTLALPLLCQLTGCSKHPHRAQGRS